DPWKITIRDPGLGDMGSSQSTPAGVIKLWVHCFRTSHVERVFPQLHGQCHFLNIPEWVRSLDRNICNLKQLQHFSSDLGTLWGHPLWEHPSPVLEHSTEITGEEMGSHGHVVRHNYEIMTSVTFQEQPYFGGKLPQIPTKIPKSLTSPLQISNLEIK
uniref:MHC class II beta chain N-terminal domain-containing protein n=1 Tax=Malurus cyaneus samueli TaxID=2593467 RepID=A0A8C5TGB9_9PASS